MYNSSTDKQHTRQESGGKGSKEAEAFVETSKWLPVQNLHAAMKASRNMWLICAGETKIHDLNLSSRDLL